MTKVLLLSALAASCALAGCTRIGNDEGLSSTSPVVVNYKALGHEPGWALSLNDGYLDYSGDYGETRIKERFGGPMQENGRIRYQSANVRVLVESIGCADSAVNRNYRDKVTVEAKGKRVTGCGGPVATLTSLNDTNWTIEKINGRPTIPNQTANISFAADRISGTAGCNRLMGGYKVDGQSLSLSGIATTRMACPQPQMEQERAVIDILGGPLTLDFQDDGRLLLHDGKRNVIELHQSF